MKNCEMKLDGNLASASGVTTQISRNMSILSAPTLNCIVQQILSLSGNAVKNGDHHVCESTATNLSEFSGILYSQSRRELEKLLAYLYPPGIQHFHREYYDHFRSLICNIGVEEKIL